MNYLIDTNILIWFLLDQKLSTTILEIFDHPEANISVSLISFYEIVIKQKIGKLPTLDRPISDLIQLTQIALINIINIKEQHLHQYSLLKLQDDHRDPFDRLIIATAIAEDHIIISSDRKFTLYTDLIKLIPA
jgi:PIN domain nuclease of toxin-antitoxin system